MWSKFRVNFSKQLNGWGKLFWKGPPFALLVPVSGSLHIDRPKSAWECGLGGLPQPIRVMSPWHHLSSATGALFWAGKSLPPAEERLHSSPWILFHQPSSLCKWHPVRPCSLKVHDPQDVQLPTRGNCLRLSVTLGKTSQLQVAPYLNYLLSSTSLATSQTANGTLLTFHISPPQCCRLERLSEDTGCWTWSCAMHHLLLYDNKTWGLVQ